jgi:AAA15 family ATPase/GTPase
MNITKIKLTNFRNYDEQEIELNKNINVFYGDNAQGKTNIIESIFLCSIGKSFRTSKDKELIKFGIYDENKRNEKIAMLLSTNSYAMTVEAVIRFKQLGTCQTTEIEVETSEGKTYSVIDSEKNLTEKNHITPESEYLKNEQSVYLEKLFCEIDDIYAKKNDVRESEIFTVALLKPFQVEKKNYVQENGSLQDFYPDIYAILAKYNCIDKAILRPFFEECDYCLPTQEEIEKKYGLNKKYAGTLLMRFRESFSGSKNIKEYFYDYLKKK